MRKEQGKEISIYIPPEDLDLLEWVEELAEKEMRSFGEMVRIILREVAKIEGMSN